MTIKMTPAVSFIIDGEINVNPLRISMGHFFKLISKQDVWFSLIRE